LEYEGQDAMTTKQKGFEAHFAITLRPGEDDDLDALQNSRFLYSAWKKRHWPTDVVRPGVRIYGFNTESRRLCVLPPDLDEKTGKQAGSKISLKVAPDGTIDWKRHEEANTKDKLETVLRKGALHIDLTTPRTTAPLLERIDDFVHRIVLQTEDVLKDHYLFRELLWLDTFRQQFREFPRVYDLPTGVCDEDGRWHEFLTHYAGVIQDGSLSCQAKTQRLKHVNEVVFSKGRERPQALVPFDLVWEIVLLDGRSIVVDVYATPLPNGKPMTVHGIELRRWNDPVLR
jgi:hypothetical protein